MPAPHPPLILIPAAGASSRMRGRDKLLEEVDGEPLLSRQLRRALATGAMVGVCFDPAGPPGRISAIAFAADPRIMGIPVPDAAEGLSASLRRGAAAALSLGGDAAPAGLMILPADMPDITTEDLKTVIADFARAPAQILRATDSTGRPGHPVVFPATLLADFAELSGDEGARRLLQGRKLREIALPGAHATTDLDTPEDWATWRKSRENGD